MWEKTEGAMALSLENSQFLRGTSFITKSTNSYQAHAMLKELASGATNHAFGEFTPLLRGTSFHTIH